MHEMGIANSILETVRAEARRFPDGHIRKVGVRVGELAGVDPDSMRFCFDALVRETDFEPLTLEIEYYTRRHQCRACRSIFAAPLEGAHCPACGGTDSEFLAGDELEFTFLEVEDGAGSSGT